MKSFVSYLIFTLLVFTCAPAFAENPAPEKLAQEMGSRITRVPEFEFIRAVAEKLGVRVYLFGGTAAAYGHYIRQDLAREGGDHRYPDFLYDYDYTNIFRSTQDLDIVVDGSAAQAEKLEGILKAEFPHFLGDKAANWEVRPLREARGEKDAILGNPDFQNQHTDSHSTGLVEVTPTPVGDIPVKDVRDWEAKKPQFLRDVAEQKLHYYFNPLHETTKRARDGLNPPILSAIRYLTKAFQYDLAIDPTDEARIRAVVRDFNPEDLSNAYVKKWIEKNGKKLFQHAVNIEYAWKTIDGLGLRKKLIELKKDTSVVDSLAWWMSKEPLRSGAVGMGPGKTAAEIFGKDLILSHETNSFLAYESLTRAKSGELNALISRKGMEGESAKHGEGFYTLPGRAGARGTGFTVRMELNPAAREGTDFTFVEGMVIVKNRAAVKVIPEKIDLSLLEFFRLLAQGKEFSADDRALVESFARKAGRSALASPEDKNEIAQLVRDEIKREMTINDEVHRPGLIAQWFRLPFSVEYPDIFEMVINDGRMHFTRPFFEALNTSTVWRARPDLMEKLFQKEYISHEFIAKVLASPAWSATPQWAGWVERTIDRQSKKRLIPFAVLALPAAAAHPEWIDLLVKREVNDSVLVTWTLSLPQWIAQPQWEKWVDTIIERGTSDSQVEEALLGSPGIPLKPRWIEKLLKRRDNWDMLALYVLSSEHWENHPELVEALIRQMNIPASKADTVTADHLLQHQFWQENAELRRAVGDKPLNATNLANAFREGFTLREVVSVPHGCPASFRAVSP